MNIWESIVKNDQAYFTRYLELIRSIVKAEKEKLHKEAERVGNIVDEKGDENDQTTDYLVNLEFDLEQMEQLMYRSFVLCAFVFMEDLITTLCRHIQKQTNQVFSVNHLGGSGIGRSIKYLEETLGRKFPLDADLRTRFEVA